MKKVLLTFAILLIIVGGIYFTNNYFKAGGTISFFKKPAVAIIDNQNFNINVAVLEKDKEVGLSEMNSISQNQGMIFLFDKPEYYSFWMKNMKFPIDIIFINNDQIVTIRDNAKVIMSEETPMIYSSTQPADKVLEIQAGLSKKYNFKIGDKVKYENLGN